MVLSISMKIFSFKALTALEKTIISSQIIENGKRVSKIIFVAQNRYVIAFENIFLLN